MIDTCGFAGDGAPEKIDFGAQVMANVVKHRGRMIGARADLIHLPGIFVQRDAERLGHFLAFVDQRVQQVAQVREFFFLRVVGGVRQFGQCGNGIH